jgi:predicted GIY-YIG superfamily endonuclease
VPFQLIEAMNYVYDLQSLRDSRWYTGMGADLRKRIHDHETGRVHSSRGRRPDEGYIGLQNHSDNDIVFFKESAYSLCRRIWDPV